MRRFGCETILQKFLLREQQQTRLKERRGEQRPAPRHKWAMCWVPSVQFLERTGRKGDCSGQGAGSLVQNSFCEGTAPSPTSALEEGWVTGIWGRSLRVAAGGCQGNTDADFLSNEKLLVKTEQQSFPWHAFELQSPFLGTWWVLEDRLEGAWTS